MDTCRIIPEDWLGQLDFEGCYNAVRPVEVDVGCGKGGFLLARAAAFPETNFLGIDRMLRRIRKIDNKVQRRGLDNVKLLRVDASYAISHMIPESSVSVYYVFFPDPWPKKRHKSQRFFDALFLNALHRTLKPGGFIHAATDHIPFFEEIEALMENDCRFVRAETFVPLENERTEFERYYLRRTDIGRCSFFKNE